MLSFEHFRSPGGSYNPVTVSAALKAVTAGLVDVETLVYRGTSVRPLVEEPHDIRALQQALSREELDIEASLLLVDVFRGMLSDPDPERALFAAEGITTVESRYGRRIEELRSAQPAAAGRLELARLSYELALLNSASPSIRAFYLREAFLCVREEAEGRSLSLGPVVVIVNVLQALGLHEQADSILARAAEPEHPELLYLRARVAFSRKQYATVSIICRTLAANYNRLRPGIRTAIEQWFPEGTSNPRGTSGV